MKSVLSGVVLFSLAGCMPSVGWEVRPERPSGPAAQPAPKTRTTRAPAPNPFPNHVPVDPAEAPPSAPTEQAESTPPPPPRTTAGNSATASAELPEPSQTLTTIAFGSCNRTDRTQAYWDTIRERRPDLFLFIGDNMYADLQKTGRGEIYVMPFQPRVIEEAYAALDAVPQWTRFRNEVPVLATWDDHDYGANDVGAEWRLKEASETLFEDFYGLPDDAPARTRPGVHQSYAFGPDGQRVQIILLDTRFFRDRLVKKPKDQKKGLYQPTTDDSLTVLGDDQWTWLEEQLREPADVRIIASSIQVVAWEHAWESWGNFPAERARLFALIGRTNAKGVIFLSGDRHHAEISCARGRDGVAVPYPMWDFTSSGLNERANRNIRERNQYRVGTARREANFGMLRIAWDAPGGPLVTFEARSDENDVLMRESVPVRDLSRDGR